MVQPDRKSSSAQRPSRNDAVGVLNALVVQFQNIGPRKKVRPATASQSLRILLGVRHYWSALSGSLSGRIDQSVGWSEGVALVYNGSGLRPGLANACACLIAARLARSKSQASEGRRSGGRSFQFQTNLRFTAAQIYERGPRFQILNDRPKGVAAAYRTV